MLNVKVLTLNKRSACIHSSVRHDIHQECVASVQRVLRKERADFAIVGREELDRQHIAQVGNLLEVYPNKPFLYPVPFIFLLTLLELGLIFL